MGYGGNFLVSTNWVIKSISLEVEFDVCVCVDEKKQIYKRVKTKVTGEYPDYYWDRNDIPPSVGGLGANFSIAPPINEEKLRSLANLYIEVMIRTARGIKNEKTRILHEN